MPSPVKDLTASTAATGGSGWRYRRLLPLAAIAAVTGLVYATGLHRELSLEALVRHRATIDALVESHRLLAIAGYVALYVAATALSIPGATILTIIGGLLFGTATGAIAAVIAATAGSVIIFLIARSALGEWLLARAGPAAAKIVTNFRADAFNYLLFLRLVPLFPFWLVNLVAALGGVAFGPFIAATAIGIIPATLVFAFFGSGLDSALAGQVEAYKNCLASGQIGCRLDFHASAAATPHLIAALAALCLVALAPVIIKRIRAARQRH
jgi:uncharacterized membrane protein YdjX (TVP38/TMEM64 family)